MNPLMWCLYFNRQSMLAYLAHIEHFLNCVRLP